MIPSFAVWETAVFVVNVLAFVFIGLQIRPILIDLDPAVRVRYFQMAGAVLLTVILVRIIWATIYYATVRWRRRRVPPVRGVPPLPSFRGVLLVGWSGMRGIVTLAAALALPLNLNGNAFPFRDLIVFTAFAVVLGTLVIQGLTLGPLLRRFRLRDDNPVAREVAAARDRALGAALATVDGIDSEIARIVRQEFASHLRPTRGEEGDADRAHEALHRSAIAAARRTILDMRLSDEIGDHAFHILEREFDLMELANDPLD